MRLSWGNESRMTSASPLLYFTAAKDQPTFERAKRTEPFTYLTKPLAPANLEAAIEATLRKPLAPASNSRMGKHG